MEIVSVLHMNGGIDDASYGKNSLLQQKVILLTNTLIEEGMTNLYNNVCPKSSLNIVDLGCSSGPTTLLMVSLVIKTIDKICKKMNKKAPEIQIFLNDLYGNDFNSLFKSFPCFQDDLKKELGYDFVSWFFNGVPGSFYERLFPINSIHFVYSSYSLQWLSQVPEGAENNKGNIYPSKSSPPCVLKAYYKQFEKDFSKFLKLRSAELVSGGHMIITFVGREGDDSFSREGCRIWELLATALNHMVSKGIIQEKELDYFNIPQYLPSAKEVNALIEMEGSFRIDCLKVSKVHWSEFDGDDINLSSRSNDRGYNVAKCMRAVAEPLLVSHFGEAIIDELFYKYKEILSDCMEKEETEFINVTVSMTKIN